MEQKQEKKNAGEIVIRNRFLIWLENFWYHYKWAVIIGGFFLVVFLVCVVQCSSTKQSDTTVSFVGGYQLSYSERNQIEQVLEAVAPSKDDGTPLTLKLNDSVYYSEERMRELSTDEDGEFSVSTFNNMKSVNLNNLNNFRTYVMTGESAVWWVSEEVFTELNLSALAVPLSELYPDTLPQGAVNAYAVRLGDTAFYRYYDAIQVLPPDTWIVFPHSMALWGESANETTYESFRQLYYAIVNFKTPS